jgi:hypothetical protein
MIKISVDLKEATEAEYNAYVESKPRQFSIDRGSARPLRVRRTDLCLC